MWEQRGQMGVLGSCLAAERSGLGSQGQEETPARRLLRQLVVMRAKTRERNGAGQVTLKDGLGATSPVGTAFLSAQPTPTWETG